jgi:hypothetical protein
MILRLLAARLVFLGAVVACVLAAAGAVIGLDRFLAWCWPTVGPANGLVLAVSAPWAVVVVAFVLAQVGRLTDRVPLPDGLARGVSVR